MWQQEYHKILIGEHTHLGKEKRITNEFVQSEVRNEHTNMLRIANLPARSVTTPDCVTKLHFVVQNYTIR